MSDDSRIDPLRNAFFTGLLLLAPLAITWWVFAWLFESIGGAVKPLAFDLLSVPDELRNHRWLQIVWNILATLLVVALITGLGWLSRYLLGRFFGNLAERFFLTIPGFNAVYTTVKQIVGTFSTANRSMFSKVVMIEYPRKGLWSVAFLTSKAQGEPQSRIPADGEEIWTVFVPTTPNPTGGFLLMLPRTDVIELDISVGEGMKMVISGGSVVPRAGTSTPNR